MITLSLFLRDKSGRKTEDKVTHQSTSAEWLGRQAERTLLGPIPKKDRRKASRKIYG